MIRIIAAFGLFVAAATATADEVKIAGQGDWPFGTEAKETKAMYKAVRTEDGLLQASGLPGDERNKLKLRSHLEKTFGAKVNFEKQMVVIVTAGMQKTSGFRVEVTKVELDADKKSMTVHATVHPPKKDDKVEKKPTHPGTVILVDKFDGSVRFSVGKAE